MFPEESYGRSFIKIREIVSKLSQFPRLSGGRGGVTFPTV
jgi:hypothetical protein